MNRQRFAFMVLALAACCYRCGGEPAASEEATNGGAASRSTGGVNASGNGGRAGDGSGGTRIVVIPAGDSGAGACGALDCAQAGAGGVAEPDFFCGDGDTNQLSEQCDDGNLRSGDGCTGNCRLEQYYSCPTPGEPCVSTLVCGDGRANGTEECDDGNDDSDDGCSSDCTVEIGWACPFQGLHCEAALCGDGLLAGREQCDDGNLRAADGCSSCKLEAGYVCRTPGAACVTTKCGDGKVEGLERCDDGNHDLGDGCTPLCNAEPDCSKGACVSRCGDGFTFGDEKCDDGNGRAGDGCSPSCEVELGFSCALPAAPARLELPLVIRDFDATHPDFERLEGEDAQIVRVAATAASGGRGGDLGQPGETSSIEKPDGSALGLVSLANKPVYFDVSCDSSAVAPKDCTLTTTDADSFHQWFNDGPWTSATVVKRLTLRRGTFTEADAQFQPGGDGYTFDSRYMQIDGSMPALLEGTQLRTPGFFPIDELGTSGTSCAAGGNGLHNFHFTSETRYWFRYDSSQSPPAELRFSGDDDLFVYVNGHLAVNLGGVHVRQESSFVLDAVNAQSWGLETGSIYEIAVFHAERHTCESNYWLTLKGFYAASSECRSSCGDGKLASDELCDDGAAGNTGEYGKCGTSCKERGPYCGDAERNGEEDCDNGENVSVYAFDERGCAPGCLLPPHCGDGEVQSSYEECDDGSNDGAYDGCNADCSLGPRCGDGEVQAKREECDDGNRRSGDGCDPECAVEVPR
jgi:fibro-slime domain-containing protein